MTLYWLLFLWPACAAYVLGEADSPKSRTAYWSLAVALSIVLGLRFRVGPDWDHYVENLNSPTAGSLIRALSHNEQAYWVLNWLAHSTGGGIWIMNLPCAMVFIAGVFVLCRRLSNPWLGIVVAMPFLIIVIGMNYPRQSAALGLAYLGIVALQNDQLGRFSVLILSASLFHLSALVVLPLALLIGTRSRNLRWILFFAITAFCICFLRSSAGKALISNYLTSEMVSGGTIIRVLLNTVAALCVICLEHRFYESPAIRKFWIQYAFTALPFCAAIFVLPPLTAIDRMAFYWMPLQIFGFANFPDVFGTVQLRRAATLGVISVYALVMLIWFSFGNYYHAWLPYRFYLFE